MAPQIQHMQHYAQHDIHYSIIPPRGGDNVVTVKSYKNIIVDDCFASADHHKKSYNKSVITRYTGGDTPHFYPLAGGETPHSCPQTSHSYSPNGN